MFSNKLTSYVIRLTLQNWFWVDYSAHRNCSDFCDLRLWCPSRTPEIARDFREFALRFKGAMESPSDLRVRVAISEPKTSSFCGISGDLALVNAEIASDCDCAILQRRRNDDKKYFWEVESKRGVGRGFETFKRGSTGDAPWNLLSAWCSRKITFWKVPFLLSSPFPGNAVTIILDNYPPSTLQGGRTRGL